MDISRRGANRNRGRTDIISKLPFISGSERSWRDNVRWHRVDKVIQITAKRIRHTDGKSHHNYTISLTLEDVAALIEILGHAAEKSDAKLLRDKLKATIPAIVKLLACAIGFQPVEIKEDAETTPPTKTAARRIKKEVKRRS